MYKINLYLKYIKFCKLKKPFYVYSVYTSYQKNFETVQEYPNKFYQITFQNGKKGIAHFKNRKSILAYENTAKWSFVGYETKKLVRDCSLKEFISIYGSLFYPHLASEEDIIGNYIADKLYPTVNSIDDVYLIIKV